LRVQSGPVVTNSSSGSGVFDLAALEASTMGDGGLQREIMFLFMSQMADVLRLLKSGVNLDWQFTAHTLRGTAAAVGAKEIEELALQWEQRAAAPCEIIAAELEQADKRFKSATDGFFAPAA
jgi:HPt (histidine-containing phosphotransfer) domain-containing protein